MSPEAIAQLEKATWFLTRLAPRLSGRGPKQHQKTSWPVPVVRLNAWLGDRFAEPILSLSRHFVVFGVVYASNLEVA